MEAIECIMTRASVRQYTGEKISEEDMLKIIKAGMNAPSARNIQPWRFIILRDGKLLDEFTEKLPYCKMLKNAGAGVVVCGVLDKDFEYAEKYWTLDCSAATENILLAAHALGYGAVWTALYPNEERISIVRAALKMPRNVVPLNIIPIGTPKEKPNHKDKFKEDIIHYDKW